MTHLLKTATLALYFLIFIQSVNFAQSIELKQGYFQFNVSEGKLDTATNWHLAVNKYEVPFQGLFKFYPSEYKSKGYLTVDSTTANFYYSFNKEIGGVKITDQDSLIYLGNTKHWINGLDKLIVREDGLEWHLREHKLYLKESDKLLELQVIRSRSAERILNIYAAEKGLWVETAYGFYLIHPQGAIRFSIHSKLGKAKYVYTNKKEILAFLNQGYYRLNHDQISFTDKSSSTTYTGFLNGYQPNLKNLLASKHPVFYDQSIKKGLVVADEDVLFDIPFSKIIGKDELGKLWGITYKEGEYYLNYWESGWEDVLVLKQVPELIEASNFAQDFDPDMDLELMVIEIFQDALYIFTDNSGVIKFNNGEYTVLGAVDMADADSILELFELEKHSFIHHVPMELWKPYTFDKAIYTKQGIKLNFYETNVDSEGNKWTVEKNVLNNYFQNLHFNIADALDSVGIQQLEKMEYPSRILLNRLVINKSDQIFMFGKRSIITYHIKEKKWNQIVLPEDAEINYQFIYEDKDEDIWFQNKANELWYIQNGEAQKIDLKLSKIAYWQMDEKGNLIVIDEEGLALYNVKSKQKQLKLVKRINLEKDIYSLNKIDTIIPHEKGFIIKNLYGYYVFEL